MAIQAKTDEVEKETDDAETKMDEDKKDAGNNEWQNKSKVFV